MTDTKIPYGFSASRNDGTRATSPFNGPNEVFVGNVALLVPSWLQFIDLEELPDGSVVVIGGGNNDGNCYLLKYTPLGASDPGQVLQLLNLGRFARNFQWVRLMPDGRLMASWYSAPQVVSHAVINQVTLGIIGTPTQYPASPNIAQGTVGIADDGEPLFLGDQAPTVYGVECNRQIWKAGRMVAVAQTGGVAYATKASARCGVIRPGQNTDWPFISPNGRWMGFHQPQTGTVFIEALPDVPPAIVAPPPAPRLPVKVDPINRPFSMGLYLRTTLDVLKIPDWWPGPFDHLICNTVDDVMLANASRLGVVSNLALCKLAKKPLAVKVSNDGGPDQGKPLGPLADAARRPARVFGLSIEGYSDQGDTKAIDAELTAGFNPLTDGVSFAAFTSPAELQAGVFDGRIRRILDRLTSPVVAVNPGDPSRPGFQRIVIAPQVDDRLKQWAPNQLANLGAIYAGWVRDYPQVVGFQCFAYAGDFPDPTTGFQYFGLDGHYAEFGPWLEAIVAAATGSNVWPALPPLNVGDDMPVQIPVSKCTLRTSNLHSGEHAVPVTVSPGVFEHFTILDQPNGCVALQSGAGFLSVDENGNISRAVAINQNETFLPVNRGRFIFLTSLGTEYTRLPLVVCDDVTEKEILAPTGV